MTPILLYLVENGERTGTLESSVVPRIGESIMLGAYVYEVTGVKYNSVEYEVPGPRNTYKVEGAFVFVNRIASRNG